jgi:hypothetical protein
MSDPTRPDEEKLRKRLADSLWLAATSRIINLVGVPAGLAVGAWMVSTVHSLELAIAVLPGKLDALQEQIKTTNDRVGSVERRVDRLEQPFFGGKQ